MLAVATAWKAIVESDACQIPLLVETGQVIETHGMEGQGTCDSNGHGTGCVTQGTVYDRQGTDGHGGCEGGQRK